MNHATSRFHVPYLYSPIATSWPLKLTWEQKKSTAIVAQSAKWPANNMSGRGGHIGRTYMRERAYEHEILRRLYRTCCDLEAGKLRAWAGKYCELERKTDDKLRQRLRHDGRAWRVSRTRHYPCYRSGEVASVSGKVLRCMYMQAGSKMNSSDESSMNISKEYINLMPTDDVAILQTPLKLI